MEGGRGLEWLGSEELVRKQQKQQQRWKKREKELKGRNAADARNPELCSVVVHCRL